MQAFILEQRKSKSMWRRRSSRVLRAKRQTPREVVEETRGCSVLLRWVDRWADGQELGQRISQKGVVLLWKQRGREGRESDLEQGRDGGRVEAGWH